MDCERYNAIFNTMQDKAKKQKIEAIYKTAKEKLETIK